MGQVVGPRIALAALTLALTGCVTAGERGSPEAAAAADRELGRWTSPELDTFADEAEFRSYLRDARRAALAHDLPWRGRRQNDNDDDTIVVTGSRIPSRNASITNVQEAGVDEGDIVKQIDRFLIILQDGRLFSVDTGAGPGAPLAVADRADVYRSADSDSWYDEMLVLGDRILVVGYSNARNASELSVFRMSAQGRLSREGTFFISSNDYYSGSNYATRLVDGNLLIYSPMELNEIDPGRPITWPLVRRWHPRDERLEGADRRREMQRPRGRRLFDAAAIHRPMFATIEPTVHSVTLCPLGSDTAGRDLECGTTAFIGARSRQLYVSPTDAFLLIGPDLEDMKAGLDAARCTAARPAAADVLPTQIYRIPVGRASPSVLGISGFPHDQFAIQARDGEFRALLRWDSARCDHDGDDAPRLPAHFAYFSTPLSAFRPALREAPAAAYTPLPGAGASVGDVMADRFTDHHLVYARLGHSYLHGEDPVRRPSEVVAVPVRAPAAAVTLSVPHNVIRAEQAGNDIVLTGYRDAPGLNVSLIDLDGAPRVGSTLVLSDRSETEGRSHAFNSLIGPDGAGVMGLPTIPRAHGHEARPVWRSRASDLSFLSVDAAGRLSQAGALVRGIDYAESGGGDGVPGYHCEVSCIDWYGNSRPIFTDGRIFALAGAELIEGRLEGGRIVEVRRINIAAASEALRR